MKKFFKIVDSSGVTHQFAATGLAAFYQNSAGRLEVEYANGSQVTFTTSGAAYTSADVDALSSAIIALNESKWTSVVDTVTLSVAPTVAFTF